MEDKQILEIMVRHHQVIESLFDSFEASLGKEIKFAGELFDKLSWELEKHFFTEEKTVFRFLECKTKHCQTVNKLVREHDEILELLNKIENDLAVKPRVDTGGLKNMLMTHKNFEEKSVYPELDQTMTPQEKNQVLKKIREIYIGPAKSGSE